MSFCLHSQTLLLFIQEQLSFYLFSENFSPVINGTSLRLIVTAGTEYIAAYTATDPDTDTTTEINIKVNRLLLIEE